MRLWPWSKLRRLKRENDYLRSQLAAERQGREAAVRLLEFLGFDVEVDG